MLLVVRFSFLVLVGGMMCVVLLVRNSWLCCIGLIMKLCSGVMFFFSEGLVISFFVILDGSCVFSFVQKCLLDQFLIFFDNGICMQQWLWVVECWLYRVKLCGWLVQISLWLIGGVLVSRLSQLNGQICLKIFSCFVGIDCCEMLWKLLQLVMQL